MGHHGTYAPLQQILERIWQMLPLWPSRISLREQTKGPARDVTFML